MTTDNCEMVISKLPVSLFPNEASYETFISDENEFDLHGNEYARGGGYSL